MSFVNTETHEPKTGCDLPSSRNSVGACDAQDRFPLSYDPGGAEVKKTYRQRVQSGFYPRYLGGEVVLDLGHKGADNPESKTVVPHAVGVDIDYPGYNGITLPFADGSVDAVFSSHCMEHVWFAHQAVLDHHRVLKVGGFIVTVVPHQHLYEKRQFLPSIFNPDHKHLFTPASLLSLYEQALPANSYRVRHLADNDMWFDYSISPTLHSHGCYEIELVLEKILAPEWALA